jgi:AraC-type DNA-binding domain-containing proteins
MNINYFTVGVDNTAKSETSYYYYPIEVEQSLINNIKIGDIDKSYKIVDEIFEINFSNNTLSNLQSKCLLYNLVGTVIKIIDKLKPGYAYTFLENDNPLERLIDCESVELFKIEIKCVLANLCKYVQYFRNGNVSALRDRIIRFVEKNYSDPNLGVSLIADEFNISIAYLSKFFKSQTGICLLDYINKIRVEKAKMLINEYEINIKDVAEKNGFYNCNSFIRIFKKYESITPGQYKKLYKSKKQSFCQFLRTQ